MSDFYLKEVDKMIRRMNISDKDSFFNMSKEFYESGAALQNIPERNIIMTFDTVISGSPYADAYIISSDGKPAGYALLAITYSNEAGGIVAWIEEIYILSEYRVKGLGAKLIEFIEEEYKDKAVKLRLEVEESNKGAARLYERLGFKYLDYIQMHKPLITEE